MAAHEVVVLSRAGCHLCVEAEAVVASRLGPPAGSAAAQGQGQRQAAGPREPGWAVADVDELDTRALEAYGSLVPVTFVAGRPVACWGLSPEQLDRALAPAARPGLLRLARTRWGAWRSPR